MEILAAAVHRLIKAPQTEECRAEEALAPLAINPELVDLVSTLLETYNRRTSQRNGSFSDDADHFPFPARFDAFVRDRAQFFEFTRWALNHLRHLLQDVFFANGGYIFFCNYRVPAGEFFVVAKLTDHTGAIFDEELSQVISSTYLNLDKLQQVGRVNLVARARNDSRYLTFVSAREGGHASNYFVEFLGCEQATSPSIESARLVSVLEAFCEHNELQEGPANQFKQRVFDYATTLPPGTPISLAALARAAWPEEPDELTAFINEHPDAPSDGIVPSRRDLRPLVKYNLRMDGMKLEMTNRFKVEHNVSVIDGNLVIHNVDERVIEELS